jgi:exodeoxyribonuclease VIII
MTHIMLDLETHGQAPGCAIVSIGACTIGDGQDRRTFEAVIDWRSCEAVGLTTDASTIEWWSKQPAAVRRAMDEAMSGTARPLQQVLVSFRAFLAQWPSVNLWSNGADFDIPILAVAYQKALGVQPPWQFFNNRCYRTIKNLAPELKISRGHGQAHSALHDAMNQAEHLEQLLKTLNLELK